MEHSVSLYTLQLILHRHLIATVHFVKYGTNTLLKGRFSKVRTGQPDHGRTGHFENGILASL